MSFHTYPVPKKIVTIGGSDSGGAAGIQADLKTFTALGAYGMCVLTVATAQNSLVLAQAHFLPPDFVTAQLEVIFADYGADGIKTGFIGDTKLIEVIAGNLSAQTMPILVDPVLVNHKGNPLFAEAVSAGYVTHLLPLATLITPNWHEAGLLAGMSVTDLPTATHAAQQLHQLGTPHILITGIPAEEMLIDLYFDGAEMVALPTPLLNTSNTLGSGDTLSSAIITFLAEGIGMLPAIERAQKFTHHALLASRRWRLGGGQGPLAQWYGKGTN